MTNAEVDQVASRFFLAVEQADWEAVRSLSAPNATFAQHVGPSPGSEQDIDGLVELLSGTARALGALGYRNVRRQVSPDGFSQVHELTFADRPDMVVAAGVVAWLDGDRRFVRVDEFLDPRPFSR